MSLIWTIRQRVIKPYVKPIFAPLQPRRHLLRLLGIDLDKLRAYRTENELEWLSRLHRVRTVIDIGANTGTYAEYLKETFRPERVIVFEPQEKHAAGLRRRGFEVFSIALGDENGAVELNINSHDASSSLLHLGAPHLEEWPHLVETGERASVPIRRLDDCIPPDLADEILIKVDVQGYEDAVLRGGAKTFGRAGVVLIEMSFVPMYAGQPLFHDVHAQLTALGFRFTGFKNQQISSRTGQPLFAHCVYERA